ncbi:Flp pilus assembly complex ATPase component TadA [Agrobacterium rubi]|nr:Flp pilus assembly complex ATPase component TadA [Agrobacterium rubi]NTF25105.1 Flp pilus assembly complex ATPase component TadA [Agrobacterium rubi]
MTAAYVNHEDIRQFLSNIGNKPIIGGEGMMQSLHHVASCFGLTFGELYSRCRSDGPASLVGLPFHRETFNAIAEAVHGNDMTALRNTKRLAIVAEAFGWKPDAFMHHLKTTTGGLGRNETMLPTYEGARFPGIAQLDSGPTIPFMTSYMSKCSNGLFLFSGPTGSGKWTTLQAILRSIAKEKEIIVVEEGLEQGMAASAGLAVQASSLRRSPPSYLVLGEIRSVEMARFALDMAEFMVVLATIHAGSPRAAVKAFHNRSDHYPLDNLRGSYSQRLVKSAPEARSYQTALCDMMVLEEGGATQVANASMGSDHMHGFYADAVEKIKRGEIEEKTIQLGFGVDFQAYLDRLRAIGKNTVVQEIPHKTLPKLADVKATAEWPIETSATPTARP